MKTLYPYLLRLIALVCISLFCSCNPKSGVWKNDQISKDKQADFHQLNDKIIDLIKANDVNPLHAFFSKNMNERSHLERIVELISYELKQHDYTRLDEYYVVNKYIDQDTINANGKGINNYKLNYPGVAHEMYMIFMVPKNTAEINRHMITLRYAKFNYGWKLDNIELAPFTLNKKTSPELFDLAKKEYDQHHLIDAVNNMLLSSTCIRPSEIWKYENETEIKDFNDKVLNEANATYKFPLLVDEVATKPSILRIYLETNDEGTYPMVYYISRINLQDTTAVIKEKNQIRTALSKLMPGIDQNKKYLYYMAYNGKPVYGKSTAYYKMVDKLTQ